MKAPAMALVAAAVVALLSWTGAWAESPTPDPSASATVTPTGTTATPTVQGVSYTFQIVDEQGKLVPDGTIVELVNPDIRPPANADEVKQAASREPCAKIEVQNGLADVTAESSADCPLGSRIAPTIFLPGQSTGMVYQATPAIEWRAANVQGERLTATLKPIPPQTGGDTGTIQPPNTGDAALRRDSGTGAFDLAYIAFGLAAVLAISSIGLALLQRKRN